MSVFQIIDETYGRLQRGAVMASVLQAGTSCSGFAGQIRGWLNERESLNVRFLIPSIKERSIVIYPCCLIH